ncbi:hypothetical protein ACG3SL_16245 [Sphingomonas sp. CJ20]
MIQGALLMLWLALLVAGDTPAGRTLRRIMVEAPARLLLKWSRVGKVATVAIVTLTALAAWLLDEEGRMIVTMMAPEAIAWFSMFEVSLWVEAVVTLAATASLLRVRGSMTWVAMRLLPARRARPRAAATRRPRRAPANDSEEAPGRLRAA